MGGIEYCEKCGYIKQQCQCEKPMTNADRIRNMTDEELAEYLKIVQEHTIKSQQIDSIEDMLSFLKSEVKEGNSNENT